MCSLSIGMVAHFLIVQYSLYGAAVASLISTCHLSSATCTACLVDLLPIVWFCNAATMTQVDTLMAACQSLMCGLFIVHPDHLHQQTDTHATTKLVETLSSGDAEILQLI